MRLGNIARVLVFAENNHVQLTLTELKARYGFEPDGTNFYYGITQDNLRNFTQSKKAFQSKHQQFFADLQATLAASSASAKSVVVGLEPNEPNNPYRFLMANDSLLNALAQELRAEQEKAMAIGKRLDIFVRFASEMNDPGQGQGKQPTLYREAFVRTRGIFRDHAPLIKFSFSPALRVDLPEDRISEYWPGDPYVDIIGGTWYIGSPSDRAKSLENMTAYFMHRVNASRPFALSEVGGCDASGRNNDAVLSAMIADLNKLAERNVAFEYATLFVSEKWGFDASLAFVQQQGTSTLA